MSWNFRHILTQPKVKTVLLVSVLISLTIGAAWFGSVSWIKTFFLPALCAADSAVTWKVIWTCGHLGFYVSLTKLQYNVHLLVGMNVRNIVVMYQYTPHINEMSVYLLDTFCESWQCSQKDIHGVQRQTYILSLEWIWSIFLLLLNFQLTRNLRDFHFF